MSDHADIVPFVIEDGLVKQGEGVRCATAIELALVAERNEARKALADYADVSGEQFDYDTLLSKYGEKARDVREYQGYARDLRARVTELEAALADLTAYAERMPGYSLHPQTERARAVAEVTE